MNLETTIRRELELAWRNGRNAGTSGSLATMEQIVDVGTERVLKAVEESRYESYRQGANDEYMAGRQSWRNWLDGEDAREAE